MTQTGESNYLFGMHDRGAEAIMAEAGRRGWVLISEAIGHDPQNMNGVSFEDLADDGFGVIGLLRNGRVSGGSPLSSPVPHAARHGDGVQGGGALPRSELYDYFATRCANFVLRSPGCHIWVVGNHPNAVAERPERGSPREESITPQLYARCYKRCREEIRSQPGHKDDMVLVAAVAPFCSDTTYPGNRRGDWVRYQQDVLLLLGPGNYDGVALHAYVRGSTRDLIVRDDKMEPPFSDRHMGFRAYQDMVAVMPSKLPVFITEARPIADSTPESGGWPTGDAPTEWVQAAYREIQRWNQQHADRQIRSLILYRWGAEGDEDAAWSIRERPGIIEDFRRALANDYQWTLPLHPEYRAVFLNQNTPAKMTASDTIKVSVRLRNEGTRTWLCSGSNPFRLASRWYDSDNREVLVTVAYHTGLPADAPPGAEVELTAKVMSPTAAGRYRLCWEMVHEGVTWFGRQGDPGQTSIVEVSAAPLPRKPPIEEVVDELPRHATRRYATRQLEAIRALVIHHSAVPPSVDAWQIARYHVEREGWPGIGYHFSIAPDGHIHQTQPLEAISYHAGDPGNQEGVGICLLGNFTNESPPDPQLDATARLVAWLLSELNLPTEAVRAHCDYRQTQCPGLTWPALWRSPLLAATQRILDEAKPVQPTPKVMGHYLLFWQTVTQWAVEEWRGAENYFGQFRVTMGFSADDAMHAECVTIVGGPWGVPAEVEGKLRAAGCKVERIPGETPFQIKAILDEMAARRQRFLTLT